MKDDRREYPRFGTLKKVEDITYSFLRGEEYKCALLQAAKVVTNTK